MNQAMKIYSYFINNKKDDLGYRLWHAENVCDRVCKKKFQAHNEKTYIMEDDSRLIITEDNLRVSLF